MWSTLRTLTELKPQQGGARRIFIYIAIAYTMSLGARLLLAFSAMKIPGYAFGGRIVPLWTEDAGLIGAYAKRLLSGETLPYTNEYMAGHLIAWMSMISGANIDTVMFYAPAFLAPLLVIPIILIMALYRLPLVGMFAAVFAAIGFNFYYRSHLGYTDTDILNFFFVFMLLYSMIAVAERKPLLYAYFGFASIVLLSLWYHAYKPLVVGLLICYFFYVIVFDRKHIAHYFAAALFVVALVPMSVGIKLLAAASVYVLWRILSTKDKRYLDYRIWLSLSLAAGAAIGLFLAASPQYYRRIIEYFNKRDSIGFVDASGTHYAISGTLKEISEAAGISFPDVILYTSGSVVVFAAGLLGLALLGVSKRSSLLLWPMLLLGMAAVVLGTRFTTFAVPVLAMGLFVLIYVAAELIFVRFGRSAARLTAVIMGAGAFWFALSQIQTYNRILKPVYNADDAALFQTLSQRGDRKDFIISWWDYGWPLWYGTGKRTLIDNGKHGLDNFIVSKILFSTNPYLSANMSRYFLSKYARYYDRTSILKRVSRKTDLQALMERLSHPPLIRDADFDIYFYFNDALIKKLPRIAEFSKLNGFDPFAGELLSYTYMVKPFDFKDTTVEADGITFDRRRGTVRTADGQQGHVARLIVSDGRHIKVQRFYRDSDYNLIVYKNKYLLMLTDKYLATFVIKGLLLNQYDPDLFELAGVSADAKVLKLKRLQ